MFVKYDLFVCCLPICQNGEESSRIVRISSKSFNVFESTQSINKNGKMLDICECWLLKQFENANVLINLASNKGTKESNKYSILNLFDN